MLRCKVKVGNMTRKVSFIASFVLAILAAGGAGMPAGAASMLGSAQAQDAASQSAIARKIGTIKTINGNSITLSPESGPDVTVSVEPNARMVRLAPGQTDVKAAPPIQLQDLQVGDKVRVRGYASANATTFPALEVVVITGSAVAAVGEQIRQDWQKRGLGGPVTAVDASAGTVTISTASVAGKKSITIHTSASTVVRRYAPNSTKFEDAKVSTLQDVHVGDQLRARGDRSADSGDLTAEEIVTGRFPNVAGLIKSVDASAGRISVQDLASKKIVELKITSDSQLHQIPAEMAQRFAARLKSQLPPGTPGAGGNSGARSSASAEASGQTATGGSPAGGAAGGGMGAGAGGGARAGGGFDLQRMLDGTPAVTLADLHKGDAVAVLATEGTATDGSTVIKLFSGVEPILQAAPNGSQAMMLAPWSLGGAPGGDASQ
jgi:hypothetical protein